MQENNENVRFLSVISYLPFLFIVGHFAVEKDNPDLRFHKFQGGVLCAVFSALYLADLILCLLFSFSSGLQSIVAFLLTAAITIAYVLMISFGIRAARAFEQKILPFVGFFAVRLRDTLDNKSGGKTD